VLLEDLRDSPASVQVIGGIYPFLDLIALTVAMLVLLRRSVYRFDPRIALFSVGIVFQVVGDILFLLAGHTGSFEQAEPLYVMNLIAIAAFFASALLLSPGSPTRQYAEREPPLWTVIAPYLPAVGMLIVFLVETYLVGTGEADPVLLGATILVGLLVIARQAVAIVENRRYIEQQRNALVSTISHELRTPLTSIVGFVELLQEGVGTLEGDEEEQMLAIVHQQADYMSRIVSDLIMLARDSGKDLRLDLAPVSMLAIARRSVHAAGVSERSVTVECDPSLVAYVDPNRIQQVLVNLLSNAERYGGPTRLLRITARGSDVIIEVHDDGPGIPKRHEVRVWDRFERGPNRLNAAIPGSGIGLAIVHAIAVAHGGTATYHRSDELGGACFVVFLPARASLGSESRAERLPSVPAMRSPTM
jgi:signal transduction histidine kinase